MSPGGRRALQGEDGVTVDLRCPICASGTRSRIMRQASYTMVEGSNCIVFTTLPMLIFSERATMVVARLFPHLRHLPEDTTGSALLARPPRIPQGPDGGRDLLSWRCVCPLHHTYVDVAVGEQWILFMCSSGRSPQPTVRRKCASSMAR